MSSGRDTNGKAAVELPTMALPFDAAAFVPPPRGADEDATPLYRQAVELLREVGPPPGDAAIGEAANDPLWAACAPGLRDWLSAAGPALELWRAGARRPRAMWLSPRDIAWPAIDRLAEELQWVRRLLSAAHLEGRRLWSLGKSAEALR